MVLSQWGWQMTRQVKTFIKTKYKIKLLWETDVFMALVTNVYLQNVYTLKKMNLKVWAEDN